MRSATARLLVVTTLLAAVLPFVIDLSSIERSTAAPVHTWDMAVDIMTRPDDGSFGGRTVRFAGPAVTYRIEGDYPSRFRAMIRDAFTLAATATDLTVVETEGPADITVVGKDGHDAYTTIWPRSDDTIDHSIVELGCCHPRSVYEDILQSFGPVGDHAESGSVFSEDPTLDRPSEWDLCVLRTLYTYPPATTADEVRTTPMCE